MNNIDTSLAGTPKPERGFIAGLFMFICAFFPGVGWGIIIAMMWSLNDDVKEWERHQQLAAMLNRDQ
jgi:hypothetical protein